MDYKKIIRSKSLRAKILKALWFVPDKPMIKLQYYIKTGRKLNLDDPVRFTEKLQWYKLYYRNPLMVRCADKYDVKDYVMSKGLEDTVIPSYGIYEKIEDIDWDVLPEQFVMKDTLGGGGSSVIIVADKKTTDIRRLKKTAENWLKADIRKKGGGREWVYYEGKKHRILFEQYLPSDVTKGGLVDYKFFCFDGKPTWLYVIADRTLGVGCGLGIYDMDFNKQNYYRCDEKPLQREIPRPKTFELMKEIAARLSEGFPEVRVDLYEVDGKVKFGEMTFFDGSGYMSFEPDIFDEILGKNFVLRKY